MEKRLSEIIARLSEIDKEVIEKRSLIDSSDITQIGEIEKRISELELEVNSLNEEKATIETRQKEAEDILKNASGKEIEKEEKEQMNELEMRNTPIYRTAFFKAINKEELNAEERAAITTATEGLALPVSTEKAIWDAVYEQHSILEDITLYQTGTILELSVHTEITAGKAGKKAEGAATTEEENVFVKVTLSGNDFSKVVRISYASAKMTAGALEAYLVSEISTGLGEVLAKEVFAKLDSGTLAANVVVNAAPDYKALLTAMGACKRVNGLTIYCSNATKYTKILGLVDTAGQPIFRDGVALGATVKVDAAAGDKIYILDPKKVVGNMIQPIMIESDRDITTQTIINAGYCRFDAALTDTASCSIIKAA